MHALVRLIQLGRPSSPVPPERGPDAEGLVLSMLSIDSKVREPKYKKVAGLRGLGVEYRLARGRPFSPVPPEPPDAEGLVLSMLSIDSKGKGKKRKNTGGLRGLGVGYRLARANWSLTALLLPSILQQGRPTARQALDSRWVYRCTCIYIGTYI